MWGDRFIQAQISGFKTGMPKPLFQKLLSVFGKRLALRIEWQPQSLGNTLQLGGRLLHKQVITYYDARLILRPR